MSRDQDIVKQLQQRLKDWGPNRECSYHFLSIGTGEHCCEYDEQGQLIALHLCGLELAQIPSEVWQLSSLLLLYLSNNHLSTLPAEVSKLLALQTLDLSYNRFSTLPAEVGNLSSLQML